MYKRQTLDISHQARLVALEPYGIHGCAAFYGFVSGICAGNYDVKEIFIDSTLKAVDVQDLELSLIHIYMEYKLKAHHIYHVYHKDDNEQLFFECRDMDAGVCTAHIYVVLENSDRWNHFLQFKDYLSINTDRLKKYNTLKQELAERYATDRRAYHQGKTRFMQNIMVEATDYFTLGHEITVCLLYTSFIHHGGCASARVTGMPKIAAWTWIHSSDKHNGARCV